ncbi:MAG: DNA polymerase III subunit beta [Candidatus Liptonbacteria bacterium]|nr:DNA polymerase III subunit beta [Candidatus Liptonbacteria bacterium]
MKVVVIRGNLKEALGVMERVGGDNLKLPILKYAVFEVFDDKSKLTATNLEMAVSYYVPGKTIEKGKTSVPIATFSSLISNLQSERLNLEKKGSQLEVKTDNYEAATQTLPVDDFPIIPRVKNEEDYLEIESGNLKGALAQVVVATQFSELRSELNSVLFDFTLDTLRLVGTDSFRLAERAIAATQFKSNYSQGFKFLIPLKTCHELLRIFKDEEEVKIYHDQNQVLFKTAQWELISRLVDGNFPDYAAVVPKEFASEVVTDRERLLNALKLAGVFSNQTNEIKIKPASGEKALEIYSASQEIGENRYLLPAKVKGAFQEVNFNWRYLADGLKALKTEEVFLGINEQDNRPTLIKSPHEASYFYILMPILKT